MGKRQRGQEEVEVRGFVGRKGETAGWFEAAGGRVDDEEKRRHELMSRMRAGLLGSGGRRAKKKATLNIRRTNAMPCFQGDADVRLKTQYYLVV